LQALVKLQDFCDSTDLFADRLFRELLDPKREGDVLEDRHMRIKRIGLEDHGNAALDRRLVVDPFTGNDDVAVGGVIETRNHAQQRGLATAGRADEDDELAVIHLEVDTFDHLEMSERLSHLVEK
jgi:hypothetical protein